MNAAGTAKYLNASFPPGNAEGLATVWAFEIPVVLVSPYGLLKSKPMKDGPKQSNKPGVLYLALLRIAGEKPEEGIDQRQIGWNQQRKEVGELRHAPQQEKHQHQKKSIGVISRAGMEKMEHSLKHGIISTIGIW